LFSLGFCCYCNSQYTRQSPWRRLERRNVDEKSHDPEEEQPDEDTPRRPSVLAALEEKSDKLEPVKPFRSYYDKDGDAR
jgi:hypothetical protein